jgi:hypothetical protein
MSRQSSDEVPFQLGQHCTQINHGVFAPVWSQGRVQLRIYTAPVSPKPVPYILIIDGAKVLNCILPSKSASAEFKIYLSARFRAMFLARLSTSVAKLVTASSDPS